MVRTMYDDLVKKLRYCGNAVSCLHCPYWAGCGGSKEDLMQAADAIEELSMKLHGDEAAIAGMKREIERMVVAGKPHWIPATERLPLLNTPVLATDGIEVDISWMYGVPPRWITSYTAIDEGKLTHWMPLPQTPKDGE